MHPKKWNMWRKLIRRLKEIMYRKGPKESKDKCTKTCAPRWGSLPALPQHNRKVFLAPSKCTSKR